VRAHIGIDAWIIQDGNYPDFRAGERYRFALEFHAPSGLSPASPARALEHVGSSLHRACGVVIHVEPDVWVCDFGVLAYQAGPAPAWAEVGAGLAGEIYIGVDHYSYMEEFRRRPGFPELSYDAVLEAIQLETTPWLDDRLPDGRPCRRRDDARQAFRPVSATSAWSDDEGSAHYVFDCQLTPVAA
jgi:hypothetical protein